LEKKIAIFAIATSIHSGFNLLVKQDFAFAPVRDMRAETQAFCLDIMDDAHREMARHDELAKRQAGSMAVWSLA
jgi:hypothetical protein